MNTPNKVLMEQARGTLEGKWLIGVKVTAIYAIISMALQFIPVLGGLVSLLISGPLTLGLAIFWLSFSRNQNPAISKMFDGFDTWWRAVKAYILMGIYIFLWLLLLIVPGIIAAYSYAMTFYILSEDKNIKIDDAINKSKEMMKGNKWKLFCLGCRFIGWGLLCILTLGIGFLWLIPYVQVSMAKFYDDVKNKGAESEVPKPQIPEVTPLSATS